MLHDLVSRLQQLNSIFFEDHKGLSFISIANAVIFSQIGPCQIQFTLFASSSWYYISVKTLQLFLGAIIELLCLWGTFPQLKLKKLHIYSTNTNDIRNGCPIRFQKQGQS